MDIQAVADRLSWTFTKTMKDIPHEYTVKDFRNERRKTDYETLFRYIMGNHYIRYFYGKPYKYCDIGGFTYWIMSDDISVSKIINRTKRR